MNHFPIQRVLYSSPQGFIPVQKAHKPEVVTIDQLKQENDFLKRQLSDLLRTQPSENRENRVIEHPVFSRTGPINACGEDLEETFKRKMSKIKSKKSSRKSVDQYNETAPSSPRKFIQNEELPIRNITNLHFVDSPLKMMVIEQDEKGKFFRNKQKEDNMATARNASVQKGMIPRNSYQVGVKNLDLPPERKFKQDPSKQNCHKRVESNLERGYTQNEEITERMFPKKTENAFRPPATGFPAEKEQSRSSNPPFKANQAPAVPIFPQKKVVPQQKKLQKVVSQERVKPSISSPRGNIYIEQLDLYEPSTDLKEPISDQFIPEDSMVSIGKGLKEKKTTRRLRYDIYLSDDVRMN